tara:strand:- start:10337 stop:10993 length:657 start_codon:yes stop_codon:yes gene_type:complete
MNINWDEQPTKKHVWIEHKAPKANDLSGWYKLDFHDRDMYASEDGLTRIPCNNEGRYFTIHSKQEQCVPKVEEWPDGATHKINKGFIKWVNGVEYNLYDGGWVENDCSWPLCKYKLSNDFKVIERPVDAPYMPKVGEWFTADHGKDYMFVGKNSYDHFVTEGKDTVIRVLSSLEGSTPIKTEREELIDIITCVYADYEKVADAILAAGFTSIKKGDKR